MQRSKKGTTRAALILKLAQEIHLENEDFESTSTSNELQLLNTPNNAVLVSNVSQNENNLYNASSTFTEMLPVPICSSERIIEATDVFFEPNNEFKGVYEYENNSVENLTDNITEARFEGAPSVYQIHTENTMEQLSGKKMDNNTTEAEDQLVVSGYNNDKENIIQEKINNKSNNEEKVVSNGNNKVSDEYLEILEVEDIIESPIIGRPKKGRKRKYPSQNREIRKLRCIQNKEYFTQKGKKKMKKEFREYLCRCECFSRIGGEKVKEEYEKFYKVTSHDAQRALICAMVSQCPIKRKRAKDSQKRSSTRLYKINGITVCKPFFLQTFRISSGKVDLALKSLKRPDGVRDCRDIGGGKNKISEERLQAVINHIDKFPKYKSHYARESTDALYLRTDTTLPVMYNLYKQECKSPVSFSKYKNIFLTNFNLRRKPLKKDTCNTCDRLQILKTSGTEEQKFSDEKENHLKSASIARSLLKADRKRAEEDKDLEVLCFDLEKTLPLPRIPTNIVFYKRQLWLYNAGIHTAKNNKGHCYIWLENEAGRGAQEVGSCLYKHIMHDEDIIQCKHLILWSDSCGGQNRNIKIIMMLKAVMEDHPNIAKITMRFLVSGHSFLPNDTDFGDIECALKFQQRMYSPGDYINVMKSCRKKNPLNVHKMEKSDFYSTAALEKIIVNRKKDVLDNKINWLHFREIEIRKEHPFSIFVKTNFESHAQDINFERKRGRPSHDNSNPKFCKKLDSLWPNGKPIAEKKLLDLKSLLNFIPADAKKFYKNLIGDPNIEEDIDGYNNELDFELEKEDNIS